jgi:uncharacterized protein YegL
MREGHDEIICILDKSGSMQTLRKDAVGGINNFILEQQKVPDRTGDLTVILFNHEYTVLRSKVDLKYATQITDDEYMTDGLTALLDAIGRTIDDVGKRLHNTPEENRPENVIVVIMTDGLENNSVDYTRDQINKMVTHQQTVYKWTFVFLGANQDSFAEARSMGISIKATSNYTPTSEGVTSAYYGSSNFVACVRSSGSVPESLTDLVDK